MPDGKTTRRRVVKGLGAAGAGALGSLAGCTGGGGDNENNDSDDGGGSSGDGGSNDSASGDSSGSSAVTVDFWSFLASENQQTRSHFESSLSNFESQHSNISVSFQAIPGGQLRSKLPTTVSAGNAPDLVEGGVTALNLRDKLADHRTYLESTDLMGDFTQANIDSLRYRDEIWAGGGNRHLVSMLAVRPKLFKDAGVDDPAQLETWTGYRRALESIKENSPDVFAYEATGTANDLECYWGEARTAYTGGESPFFGEKAWENPMEKLKIGENSRTDGMIRNLIDNTEAYSSNSAPSRGDEDMPSLLLTDQAASYTYGLGNPTRYETIKSDVTFGWDGDIWQGPVPKLDANYGDEFGIDELAGMEGEHGGHLWSLQMQKQAFDQDGNKPDEAFELMTYVNTSEDHNLKLLGEIYPSVPAYKPLSEKIQNQYDLPQIQAEMFELVDEYGQQYRSTGAPWDLENTSQIRWTDINQTLSEALAGQYTADEAISQIRENISQSV